MPIYLHLYLSHPPYQSITGSGGRPRTSLRLAMARHDIGKYAPLIPSLTSFIAPFSSLLYVL
jgi:hypothetical protein